MKNYIFKATRPGSVTVMLHDTETGEYVVQGQYADRTTEARFSDTKQAFDAFQQQSNQWSIA